MSSYLCFKKNNVSLCSYARSHPIYQALYQWAPNYEWKECTVKDLQSGLDELDEDIKKYQAAIDREQQALPYLKSSEDVHETISSIASLKEGLEEAQTARCFILFMMDIADEKCYAVNEQGEIDYDKPIDTKLQWMVD